MTRQRRMSKYDRPWYDSCCTPPDITDRLMEFFAGPVDVDPCSNPTSIVQARLKYEEHGLILPWRIRRPSTAYENPPYSAAEAWTTKAIAEMECGNVSELVRLTMMCTSTQWWAMQCYKPKRNPRILALKRLAFIDVDTGAQMDSARFEPALTYFGPRVKAFERVFAPLTMWTTWGRQP